MLKGVLAIKIVCHLAITFTCFTSFVLSGRLNLPWPEQNKPGERPLHANEITPNLHGLSNHGKAIEKRLEDRLKAGELKPTQIGEARVQMMFREKNSAEHQRNARHLNGLYQKKRIRKESGTFLGRKNLWSDRVMERYKMDKEEKKGFNKTLRDIANDTKVHKKLHTIGDKDAKYINKTKWKDSHAYGYDTDGNSKGSSFGYRSRSPSPNNEVERPRRDDTPPPSPVKSSSTISPLPSLSLTKYSTTSSSSDDFSGGGTFSTATSKRKPKNLLAYRVHHARY